MNETLHFSDLTQSLIPRSMKGELTKPEGEPEKMELKPDEIAGDEDSTPSAPAAISEYEDNPLLKIVEEGMEAGGDPVKRKVPNDERSTVGKIAPGIT